MDPILKALRDYRLQASPEKKAADLKWLETECIAGVNARAYMRELSVTTQEHCRRRGSGPGGRGQ